MSTVAQIAKNDREESRVSRDDYKGHDLINIRIFYAGDDGQMRPGRQGIAFKAGLLTNVIGALQKAGST